MGQCNCQKENSLLTKENNNYIIFLLILIVIGLFLIYRGCGK